MLLLDASLVLRVYYAVLAANDRSFYHLKYLTYSCCQYADRAKEIKTHIVQNVGTVESHVSDYQRIVDSLQVSRSHCYMFLWRLQMGLLLIDKGFVSPEINEINTKFEEAAEH